MTSVLENTRKSHITEGGEGGNYERKKRWQALNEKKELHIRMKSDQKVVEVCVTRVAVSWVTEAHKRRDVG